MHEDRLLIALVAGLPPGLAINAGALLGVSLGRLFPEIVGPDVVDAGGTVHPGISTRTLPILKASPERLDELAGKARPDPQVTVVDLTQTAQEARTYAEYSQRLASLPAGELQLIGLALHGPKGTLTSLTGDLPLYR